MKLRDAIVALALAVPCVSQAQAGGTVVLDGANYTQTGSLTNTSMGPNITSFTYSFGTPGDGIATWDSNTGGGTASDFLSAPCSPRS